MKKLVILLLFSLFSIYNYSQETYKIDYDIKDLEGTWIATSGNKSYEINFVKKILSSDLVKTRSERVVGSIKYLENNKVIKTVNEDGYNSPLITYFRGPKPRTYTLHYTEEENGKEIYGFVNFDISPDSKTAQWYLRSKIYVLKSTKENFDIPTELTFTKKQ